MVTGSEDATARPGAGPWEGGRARRMRAAQQGQCQEKRMGGVGCGRGIELLRRKSSFLSLSQGPLPKTGIISREGT